MLATSSELVARNNWPTARAPSTNCAKPAPVDTKLTPVTDQKFEREESKLATESSSAGQHQQQVSSDGEAPSGQAEAAGAPATAFGRGRGLLQALLGERSKSWLEQRTVILDIRNGERPNGRQESGDKHKLSAQKATESERDQATERCGQQAESALKSQNNKRPPAVLSNKRQASCSSLRVPTFGSVPQRVSRIPYLSYHGRARNVCLSSAQDRRAASLAPAARASSAASLRATSSSAASSTSSSGGGQSRVASTESNEFQQTQHSTRSSPSSRFARGYSNISNLFPRGKCGGDTTQAKATTTVTKTTGEPKSGAGRQQQAAAGKRHLASQTSASATELKPCGSAGVERAPTVSKQNWPAHLSADGGQPKGGNEQQTASMQPRTRSSQSVGGYQRQAPVYSTLGSRARQVSGGGGGGGVRRASSTNLVARRPLSSAGHYAGARSPSWARAPSARLRSARYDSPYGSALVDPDCPVHGDEQRQRAATLGLRGYAGQPAGRPAHRRLEHAFSQPELLYERALGSPDNPYDQNNDDNGDNSNNHIEDDDELDDELDNYQRVNWAPDGARHYEQRSGAHAKSSPAYSPLSPGAGQPRPSSRQRHHQQAAYYNSASRFSLYRPTGDGIQSSLAPTSEQLRRILGRKPAPARAKPVHLHPQWAYSRPFIHLRPTMGSAGAGRRRSSTSPPLGADHDDELLYDSDNEPIDGPRFWPFNRLQDAQAIRAVDFHPSGQVYAVGSNSRALRICAYPAEHELSHFNPLQGATSDVAAEQADQLDVGGPAASSAAGAGAARAKPPRVLFKFLQLHRGSIYCVAFNPGGHLLATGSNDQTVHLVRYNSITHNPHGDEFRLTMHNGTVRDLCFIDDSFGSGSSLLLSAGGGDNKIYVTDCDTVTPYQSMAGHTQMVMGLNHCSGAQFVSASCDRTIRFWDLRTRACTSIVSAPAAGGGAGAGAPVSSLRVDPSGRLLASGHTDSTCMLYDIRGAKIIQTFRPHDDEIRAISFSPKSYYLLTGSYDGRLVVSDLQGDLTRPLPSACVAQCSDKIVQAKWHPTDFTFAATSADKSATLWALPGEFM